jgi:hypothetical protein
MAGVPVAFILRASRADVNRRRKNVYRKRHWHLAALRGAQSAGSMRAGASQGPGPAG